MTDMAVRLELYSRFLLGVMDMQTVLTLSITYMNLELCEIGIVNL